MFTGIVKEVGKVRSISGLGGIYKLSIEAGEIASGLNVGDSVSVNGICLTFTGKSGKVLEFDVMGETFNRTAISRIRIGDPVNLESAIRAGDPMGGHFVTGHIDCVGRIREVKHSGANFSLEVSIPAEYKKLVVEKGSIALDGVSLTVGAVGNSGVTVYVIPHTLKATTLGLKRAGDELNIEFDIIGKYILGFTNNKFEKTDFS